MSDLDGLMRAAEGDAQLQQQKAAEASAATSWGAFEALAVHLKALEASLKGEADIGVVIPYGDGTVIIRLTHVIHRAPFIIFRGFAGDSDGQAEVLMHFTQINVGIEVLRPAKPAEPGQTKSLIGFHTEGGE